MRRRLLFTLAHAIAIAFNDRDLCVMQQPIQQGHDAGRIGKDFVPFLEGTVSRQDDWLTFVSPVDDLVKQVGRFIVEGQVSDFVDKCSAEHLSTNVKLSEMWS
jgi:hypothetical protein